MRTGDALRTARHVCLSDEANGRDEPILYTIICCFSVKKWGFVSGKFDIAVLVKERDPFTALANNLLAK
jgi:hypothetical protein